MAKVTGQTLYLYANKHGLCTEVSSSWMVKHFSLIAESIYPDEQVLTAFSGFHNYQSISKHDGCFAYVITDKRFILAQKKIIGSVLQTISLQNVNDITMKKGLVNHTITVDTIKETFNVNTSDAESAKRVYTEIHNALETAKSGVARSVGAQNVTAQLVELKKLLNAGIINQRDFETKKKQILGI